MTTETTATRTDKDRALLRSPGLGQFRKSPFRLLRLPTSATAKQAVWQCDKALARARVGMALPDPDPVPWLPSGDEIEIQEAAQTMESPLARLVEQLLWFDVEGDPHGGELRDALAAQDPARLRTYLTLPLAGAPTPHKIDQANLRMLLGLSALRGIGPTDAPAVSSQGTALQWQTGEADGGVFRASPGIAVVDDPHKILRGIGDSIGWAKLLGDGISQWGELLESEELTAHVGATIDKLGDELLTRDDTEAVLSAIKTRLADLIVGETRSEMASGDLANVGLLSELAGKSKIDSEVWLVAFRPLRTQFQSELGDLDPNAQTGLGVVEDVMAYLDRLETLATRWRPLDKAQLLGLGLLIDEADAEAFGKLRGLSREEQLEPRFREVLDRVGALAESNSLKERIKAYTDRLADVRKGMCHFCGKRELDGNFCASLSSSREISRVRIYNGWQVQYQVGARPVARCEHCAKVHGFIRQAGSIGFFVLSTSILLLAILHPATWFRSWDFGTGAALTGFGIAAMFLMGYGVREIAAAYVTPKGERRFGDYQGSTALEGLRKDGFHSMKYDFRSDAWNLVNKQGVKHRHAGGDAGVALKWILQIGAVILFISLRVCIGH